MRETLTSRATVVRNVNVSEFASAADVVAIIIPAPFSVAIFCAGGETAEDNVPTSLRLGPVAPPNHLAQYRLECRVVALFKTTQKSRSRYLFRASNVEGVEKLL